MTRSGGLEGATARGTIAAMRGPPITLQCDCGAATHVAYGERWTCPECGKTWDTAQIPSDDYAALVRSVRRYRLLAVGPPLVLALVFVPLAIFVGIQFAFLLFVLILGHGLFVMPKLREQATKSVRQSVSSWKLGAE